jgi:hypothetical protein
MYGHNRHGNISITRHFSIDTVTSADVRILLAKSGDDVQYSSRRNPILWLLEE